MAPLKIYLAAPLFNERERSYNAWLVEQLSPAFKVFLPQRDGALLADMVAAGVPLKVAETRVFENDCNAMRHADLLVAVLDGGHIDEGVAFEIGYVRALNIVAIGLQTDTRRALPTGNNPMIEKGLGEIFTSAEELLVWTETFARVSSNARIA